MKVVCIAITAHTRGYTLIQKLVAGIKKALIGQACPSFLVDAKI